MENRSESSIREPSRSSWFPLWPGAEANGTDTVIEFDYSGPEIGKLQFDATPTQAEFYFDTGCTNYVKFKLSQYANLAKWDKWIALDPYTTATVAQHRYFKVKYIKGDWAYLDTGCTNCTNSTLVSWDYTYPDEAGPIAMSAAPTSAPQILIPKDSSKAKEATERARRLLKSILTAEQWREYEEHGTITISSQSGVRYRLDRRSRVRNITRLGEGDCAVELLCCHPVDDLPIEDVLVAQKLHLECAEASFRKTANITPAAQVGEPRYRR